MRITKEEALSRFKKYLQKNGRFITFERTVIFDEVFHFDGHFEAEELVEILKKGENRISRATIYRTLKMFEEIGFVRKMYERDRHATYEFIHENTHFGHLICERCGKVIELRGHSMEALEDRICQKHRFRPSHINLQINGVCSTCVEKEEAEESENTYKSDY
ncbi:Fur family transcriptional regulator [Spirochaeta cellobiosiphila]|uniref:Fur family transcriptional regulator n=1 Tax=Spirochaeta cellobiosiphila TaxID=504483 RepID=UPI0004085751|nr:transcriptional repressor [Spirochaeta cellobiosiphila]